MVVFTCQHCGDSVKKPTVEKHYNTKCRYNSPHLTCVDCLKDFSSEDYATHNQCVTEEQRYSAQGTIFKGQRGRKKQEQYVEMIQKILNSKDFTLSLVQRQLLEVCSTYDNIPRKLKPFKNFLFNVGRFVQFKEKDCDDIFNIIEHAWKEQTQILRQTETLDKGKSHEEKKIIVQEVTTTNEEEVQNKSDKEITGDKTKYDICKKSKKKKNSKNPLVSSGELGEMATENTFDDCREELTNDKKSSKQTNIKSKIHNGNYDTNKKIALNEIDQKDNDDMAKTEQNNGKKENHKRKSKCLEGDDESNSEIGQGNVNNTKENITTISKKQLKKQKKYEKYLAELENESTFKANENSFHDRCGEELHDSKKIKAKNGKLKNNRYKTEVHQFTADSSDVNKKYLTDSSEDKQSKRRKTEENVDEIPEKKDKGIFDEGAETSYVAAFNWGEVIMKVLSSRPDKELSLKKLGKKVVNEYQAVKPDHRAYEELLHKFNKKVNKTKGIRVLRDKAKLIE